MIGYLLGTDNAMGQSTPNMGFSNNPQKPQQDNATNKAIDSGLEVFENELLEVESQLVGLQKLMQRREHLRMVIASLKQLKGDNPYGIGHLTMEAYGTVTPPTEIPLWKRAEQVLSHTDSPMTAREIMEAIVALGGTIDGKTPVESIRTTLIRKPEIFRRVKDGRFCLANGLIPGSELQTMDPNTTP
jgi:hypothetical protein